MSARRQTRQTTDTSPAVNADSKTITPELGSRSSRRQHPITMMLDDSESNQRRLVNRSPPGCSQIELLHRVLFDLYHD